MAEQGVRDYHSAKQKACERLGIAWNQAWLPGNQEISEALAMRLQLFTGRAIGRQMERMLGLAVDLMELLSDFEPRLVGALLRGEITARTPVEIHLFSDNIESVAWQLDTRNIPYDIFEKRLRTGSDRYVNVPGLRFIADEMPVELLAFTYKDQRQAPLSPVDGRPMQRAGLARVKDLLAQVPRAG